MPKVIVIGLGAIGVSCAHAVRADRGLCLRGLVDKDPAKWGAALEDIGAQPECAPEGRTALRVQPTLDKALEGDNAADVAIVCTSSDFVDVAATIQECLDHGLSVVSSCEQMAWPWYRHEALAQQVDAAAQAAGCAVLGTGVNPGFVMDSLAVSLAGVLRRVRKVRCVRRLDAGLRRLPLQKKVGATLSVEQFRELAAAGRMGHRGLAESAAMLAAGLGRKVEPGSVVELLEPVVTDRVCPCELGLIEPGRVAGMRNIARWEGDGLEIELDLTMAVGVEDAADRIEFDGPVHLRMRIPGATPGDSATVAMLVNQARQIRRVPAGLRTMLDMPPAGCR
jgi:2,4-diaminopentanoate dehydrogenase